LLLALAVGLVGGSVWFAGIASDLPSLAAMPDFFDPGHGLFYQPTRLYDRSGQHLLLTLENPGIPRRYLKVDPAQADHFSPDLVRVTIALLDPSFWSNPGFLASRWNDPQPQTLAERLVMDLFLSQEPSGLRRTLRMRLLAAEMVSQYGRTQVLEWYLNSANFGHLAYGAESAARLYLDKSASEVNVAEAALLVPLTETPALNPMDSPIAALERQKAGLEILREEGVLSEVEYQQAQGVQLRLRKPPASAVGVAAAFTAYTLDQLSAEMGRQRLERGGLRITTSLDYDLQLEMECLLKTQLNRLEGRESDVSLPDGSACQAARLLPTLPPGEPLPAELAASGVVLDPLTGQILAMLGDTTLERESPFPPAHAPGSLLTPVAAVTAFARSYGPASLVWDVPASLPKDLKNVEVTEYHGPVRLRLAIANDYLAPQAQILEQIGAENVWQLAANLGLAPLGSVQNAQVLFEGDKQSLADLAQAYAVFPNLGGLVGQHMPAIDGSLNPALSPVSVLYAEDAAGRILLDGTRPDNQPVLSASLAYLVHSVLSDEPARWPSMGYPNPLEIGRPAGAKAGRVSGGREVWSVGYTPQRVALFWLGLPEAQGEAVKIKPDPRQAAGLWHAMIQYATRSLPVQDWQIPAGVTTMEVCDPSGQLPTATCPDVVQEVFLNGNEPVSYDSLFRAFQVNRETGRLATVFTPPGLVDEHVFMVVPPEARDWALNAGIELPPEVYDAIQPPAPSSDVQILGPEPFSAVRGKVTLRGTAAGPGFTFYRLQAGAGLNPQNWIQIGVDSSMQATNGVLGEWDTQGLNGLYALRLLVVRQDQTVDSSTIQVTVDNTSPLARVLYPLPGQHFKLPADVQVTFQAEASDAVGMQRVEWLVDGQVVGQNLVAPYSFTWNTQVGQHTLIVRAYDLAGNTADSAPVTIFVDK
jgi:membrane peptidoglycan carboxypeptidase